MQGTLNGRRRRGRKKKRWEDNIREWTGFELRNTLRKAEDREEWKAVVRRFSAAPRRIPNLRDRCILEMVTVGNMMAHIVKIRSSPMTPFLRSFT
ncbi:hypothetical protein PoB_007584500 [Plakobranchus ocellatus]|uniref:Uncharacterized protein n=1 Tax=Plakobranchus ocellatus TaxID=259542 RepID=A0AAV4DZ95_9GAST|nr:hypothetical protein PoB_007584500 [Plakobranchus ocellatus]